MKYHKDYTFTVSRRFRMYLCILKYVHFLSTFSFSSFSTRSKVYSVIYLLNSTKHIFKRSRIITLLRDLCISNLQPELNFFPPFHFVCNVLFVILFLSDIFFNPFPHFPFKIFLIDSRTIDFLGGREIIYKYNRLFKHVFVKNFLWRDVSCFELAITLSDFSLTIKSICQFGKGSKCFVTYCFVIYLLKIEFI